MVGNASRAVFIDSDGTMTDLGILGGRYSSAYGINDSGQVVGNSNTADGATHAFLYSDGIMIDLGTLGGSFSSAHNSGQIVGYGTYNGQGRAFLLTPESAAIAAPEPASFVLFGLGVIGMAFVAVRRRHESQTAKA